MKFFLDTEFIERGPGFPISPISIGLVREDGAEYYAEFADTDLSVANDWVKQNVVPHLLGEGYSKTRVQIRKDILAFVGNPLSTGSRPEFWAYFADYDWVVFCQIFGTMIDLPEEYPHFCLDLKQWMYLTQVPRSWLPQQEGVEHNALADARWNRSVYAALVKETL